MGQRSKRYVSKECIISGRFIRFLFHYLFGIFVVLRSTAAIH
jgi:hypothetical protein